MNEAESTEAVTEAGRAVLRADLLASVVVFLVALPLCMGIAVASGAPPEAGLITGIVGGLLVGAIGGAEFQVSGPAAGLAVIVLDLMRQHGAGVTASLVVLAGVIQLLAGSAKMGRWFRAVPPAVIHGMLAGIGVLIFAAQFHVMLDDAPRATGLQNLIAIPMALVEGLRPPYGEPHHQAAVVGFLTILSLVAWSRWKPQRLSWVPAPLVAVVTGTSVAAGLGLAVKRIVMPAVLLTPGSFPGFENLATVMTPGMLGTAMAIAFIASAETLLTAAAVERLRPEPRTRYDRELSAQGLGNIVAGALGGLPMTGVIVRSAANVEAGARTRRSAVLHGAWILAFAVLFPWVLELVPIASLAAVLVYTGYKLVNMGVVRELEKFSRIEVGIYAATVATIVAADLLTGVLTGLALGLVRLVVRTSNLRVRVERTGAGASEVVHLEGTATFLSLPRLADALDDVKGQGEVRLCFDGLASMDHACMELIEGFEQRLTARGVAVEVPWEQLRNRHLDRSLASGRGGAGPGPGAQAGGAGG